MIDALTAAARYIAQRRVWALMLWPLLGASLLWAGLLYLFWSWSLHALQTLGSMQSVQQFLESYGIGWVVGSVTAVVLLLLLPTLVIATAVFITALFAMPVLVNWVSSRDYPELWRERGGSFTGGVVNAVGSLLLYFALWLLLLPIWLILPVAAILPILLNAYLNQRVFRYDALAEHASADEYRELCRRCRAQWFGLGVVAAILQLIPVINLIAPIYSGLSFIQLGLLELQKLRHERQSGSVLLEEPQWRRHSRHYRG